MLYTLTRLIRTIRRRRGLSAALLFAALLVSLTGNTLTFFFFERSLESAPTIWDSFWYSVVSITTIGYGDFSAESLGARIGTAVFIIAIGLMTFTTVVGMSLDWIVDLRYKERRGMGNLGARDHLVIVNFPNESRVRQIVDEFRRDHQHRDGEIAIVTDQVDELPASIANVLFVKGSPLEQETFERANIARASRGIVLSPDYNDPRSDSLVASIAFIIENMNREVSIIAECLDPRHDVLFNVSRRVSLVYTLQVANNLLVQEAQDPGVYKLALAITSNAIEGTLASTTARGIPGEAIPYGEVARKLLDHAITLVGVVRDGAVTVGLEHLSLAEGDALVYISKSRHGWKELRSLLA